MSVVVMVSKPENVVAFVHSWCEERIALNTSSRAEKQQQKLKHDMETQEGEDGGLYSDNECDTKDGASDMDTLHPASDKDSSLGPLPPGWEEATDEDGDTYYINHNDETVRKDKAVC